MTELTYNLPAHYYVDADIYKREMTYIFAASWQFAGHQSRLKNVGDYFTFELAGQNGHISLFCVRTKGGEIRAFYNVCPHRAHALLEGEGNTKLIVCPYHAWTYQLDGKLRRAPNEKAVEGFDKENMCLNEVALDNFLGFIFVNLDKKAASMDVVFPGIRQEIARFLPNIENLAPFITTHISEACNWKIAIENYAECYHCALNHPALATGIIKAETYRITPKGYCFHHTTQSQPREEMSYELDVASNPFACAFSTWFLWPGFSFQVYPNSILNTYQWRAEGVDNVSVWRAWYSLGGQECANLRKLSAQDLKTTVSEDIRLVESVHKGMRSQAYQPGPIMIDAQGGVHSEHCIALLQSWVRDAIDEKIEQTTTKDA